MQRKPSKKPLTVRKAANQAKKAHAAKSRKGAKGSVRQQGAGTRGQSGGKAAAAAVSATRTTRTAAAKRRPRASSVSEASSAASVLDLRLRAGGELESSVSEASSAASVRTAKPSRAASAKTAKASRTASAKTTKRSRRAAVEEPRKGPAAPSTPATAGGAAQRIEALIEGLGDWRGERLAEIRRLIHETDPGVVEEWKWMGTPVWSHSGMVVLANAHKDKVKVTFFHGAKLPDPEGLFNAGLGGNKWRAIDLREGDRLDRAAFKGLLRAAVAYNEKHSVPKSRGSKA